MRNKYMLIGVGVVVGVLLSSAVFVWAGNLDSPDVPANTLSFNLEDIYNRLNSGAAGAQAAFTEPGAAPGATGHTLDDVMAKAPARDDTNGALTGEVENGKTFWGLNVAGGEWGLQTGTADCAGGGAGVPKTGQTTKYADGDDGDLEKGVAWPSPRFTDNSDGTVTDNLTGLIWLKNANCAGGTANWATALSYSNALYDGCTSCFGGSTDCGLSDGSTAGQWRLPNVRELFSLIHWGVFNPAVPNTAGTGQWTSGDPFTGVQLGLYWSSTTCANYTSYAWHVDLFNGIVDGDGKTNAFYVWPVRGGQ